MDRQRALDYHSKGRPGKIEVTPSKPCNTQMHLSLAYTPGVAEPCLMIHDNPDDVFKYTARGNLVAVITNGTAVLGLGNIGPLAAKPVMEGKAVLFKRFADIDVFDIELNTVDSDEIIRAVKLLEPTFGGINLEDIKAPECFYIEEELKKVMNIPVFHDDQHGTAIITSAALINACELTNRKLSSIKIVINGAGAAGIACAKMYMILGVLKENIWMCDTYGLIYKGRAKNMNPYKEIFAQNSEKRTLPDVIEGADVFIGLSVKGAITSNMLKRMAKDPIIFALANPDPEIMPDEAKTARPDAYIATGRSDFPNQVNNVLGFPFIFRGALDVGAKAINDEMKLAAANALAALAREDVPDSVLRAYGVRSMRFGSEYIIPKPLDQRVLLWVAPAVAKAAIESGVARKFELKEEEYITHLEGLLGASREIMRHAVNIAKLSPKRIVFTEGYDPRILRSAELIIREGVAKPILLGKKESIISLASSLALDLTGCEFVDPFSTPLLEHYSKMLYEKRQRKGVTIQEAKYLLTNHSNYFGAMMVLTGDADGMVLGETTKFRVAIKPVLEVIGTKPGISRVGGIFMVVVKNKVYFFGDAIINIDPDANCLAEVALQAVDVAKFFGITPRVAMLSFTNFGSTRHPLSIKMHEAVRLIKERDPKLEIDGEMQADTAVSPAIIKEQFPFCNLKRGANVLIFPDLGSCNIAYKLLIHLGGAEIVGPLLFGLQYPVNVVVRDSDPETILNLTAVTVCQAQRKQSIGALESEGEEF